MPTSFGSRVPIHECEPPLNHQRSADRQGSGRPPPGTTPCAEVGGTRAATAGDCKSASFTLAKPEHEPFGNSRRYASNAAAPALVARVLHASRSGLKTAT